MPDTAFQIDPRAYLLLRPTTPHAARERCGYPCDLAFMQDDGWLGDTAVIENLVRRQGTWEIRLVFAHYCNPLRFLSRPITTHTCPRRAAHMASLMRRLAAKDARGTLRVRVEDLALLRG
ncbi:MAG: hypothetical protein OHK0039_26790 [Bacteroidia bacterium]